MLPLVAWLVWKPISDPFIPIEFSYSFIPYKLIVATSSESEFAHVIQLKIIGSKAVVWGYYNPLFVEQAKSLKGEWNQTTQCWYFTDKLFAHLAELLLSQFHVDGKAPYPVCRLHVKQYSAQSYKEACMLFDRPIFRSYGRDSPILIQPDIYKLSGSFRTGGSHKNWRTIIEDACFEIHKFPTASLEREDVKAALLAGWVELLP